MELTRTTLDELMRDTYSELVEAGETVESRRGASSEIRGVTLRLKDPRARLSRSLNRGRVFSCLGELAWYLAGSDRTDFISRYISEYLEQDEKGRIPTAYGPRLFGEDDNRQIMNAISLLKAHPSSRRAVIQVFDRMDGTGDPADVPCTCTLQFLYRKNGLDLIVYMRSNDAYLGLPHDIFAFTMLQELVARSIGSEMGEYVHMIGSLHLYEHDRDSASKFLEEGVQSPQSMSPMPDGDPWADVDLFLKREAEERAGASESRDFGEGYWADLARMVAARMTTDPEKVLKIREEITSSFFHVYLTDRAYLLEDRSTTTGGDS